MAVVLGVDGGGTKTTCAIARDGRVIGSATAGGTNLVRIGDESARAALHSAILQACSNAGLKPTQIEAACVGVGGASRENISARVRDIVTDVLSCPVEVVGDMVIAHEAAWRGGPGVIVIAGTGSIAYGANTRGESARAGGWGPAISDEGSGFWIGKSAISICLRALDSGRSTTLIRHIMEQWKIVTRDDLITTANANPRPNFAELVPAVLKAAAESDTIAQELLTDAGSELAKLAKVVIRRLWPGQSAVNVAATGGIFVNSEYVFRVFENSVRAERAEATVRLLAEDPVIGAIYRAEQLLHSLKTRDSGL